MNAELQTIAALLIVAFAAAWLVVRALKRKKRPGCGDDCGALSPEVKRLQARLKRQPVGAIAAVPGIGQRMAARILEVVGASGGAE